MALEYEEVEVTPALAKEWLESMADNRRVSDPNLRKLSRAMRDGRWHNDGAPIRFNTGGHLIDGQHRLTAQVETNTTVKYLVVRGVPQTAMATIDTGKARSAADIIGIHFPGTTDLNNVSATTTIALRWMKGNRLTTMRNAPISNDELLEFFGDNQEALHTATRIGRKVAYRLNGMTAQAYALAAYLFAGIDEEDATFFWDRLMDGKELPEGSPILALREFIMREMRSSRPRMRVDFAVAYIIKAWNAYRAGSDMRVVTYRAGGASPERYPEPQ